MKQFFTLCCGLLAMQASAQWNNDPSLNNPISVQTNLQYAASITTDGAGGAIIVWSDWRSGEGDVYAQRINAAGQVLWDADGKAVCTATGNQSFPTIYSDAAGGAFIVWQDNRGANQDIYMQRMDANGNALWTADGVAVCNATGTQYNPNVLNLGGGACMVAWHDDRTSANSDVYMQKINNDGTAAWAANGVLISNAAGYQLYPKMTIDAAGGAIVVWQDSRSGGSNYDIYAQRIDATGAVQWTANGVAVCTASGMQGDAELLADGAGGALIVWEDYRPSTSSDVYMQRINNNGVAQWNSNGNAICTAANYQNDPKLVSDGNGGAIITWFDYRSDGGSFTNFDIYAQRVNSAGAFEWTSYTTGLPVCTSAGRQQLPQIVTDGTGGAIIAWQDNRNGNNDVYAARVSADGSTPWITNGVVVANAANGQDNPVLVSDGSNGAIVAWADNRNSNYDLYASRIFAGGTLPVVLNSFTGKKAGATNELNWVLDATAAHYQVVLQVSTDGIRFNDLYKHSVAVASSRKQYQHTNVAGTLYYRLKMSQSNGNVSFSHVLVLGAATSGTFKLYPTVAQNQLTVQAPTAGELRIVQTNGQVVYRMMVAANSQVQIPVTQLTPGTYYCVLGNAQQAFIKQ